MDGAVLAAVRDLRIDQDYQRRIVERLTAIGSSPLGFRNTGTPEDEAVAAFVAAEMRETGLSDVAVEDVEVDAWRFRSATLRGGPGADEPALDMVGVSFGGVPATPTDGITAALVDVGDARRRGLDRRDLRGAIALVDWRKEAIHPSVLVDELARRGAVGMVVNCPDKGPWYQTPGALGAFDGHWPTDSPPMILIRKEDAATLRSGPTRSAPHVTMTLDVDLVPGALGRNVVGYYPGDLDGPIVVGAHHDAWFRGAFDNTSGVAALLAMAKALSESGYRPRHTICFTSRTGEEYGIAGSVYDWCIGAWRQVESSHPEWTSRAPFHLCVEASGHRTLRTVIEAPVEMTAWSRRVCRAADAEGWVPTGWRIAPPVAGTEQWPLLVSGIPGVASYAWEHSFGQSDYHTQFDTQDLLDLNHLAAQTRLYALLLLDADRDPDAVLDHRARARQLATIAAATEHPDLEVAARQRRDARGRQAFTAAGQGFFALDAHAEAGYPHEQALKDNTAIEAALAALDRDDRRGAARKLRAVGSHFLFPYLSEAAFRAHNERYRPDALKRTWASRSHLTASPHLWAELSCLLEEPGARPYGPWVAESLIRARDQTRAELTRRLDAMSRSALTRHPSDSRSS